MIRFEKEATFDHPASVVRAWHFRPGALARMLPPFQDATILDAPAVSEGAVAKMKMRLGPFAATWHAQHHDVDEALGFSDTQIKGPFRAWTHRHEFSGDEKRCLLKDTVDFKPPLPGAASMVRSLLHKGFAYRNQRLAHDLNAHSLFSQKSLTFAITSRVKSTTWIAKALSRVSKPECKTLVCSSGAGIYGDQQEEMTETHEAGEGFLAEVCVAWEAACNVAHKAGVRTAHLRTGLVLAVNGGLLARMIPPFQAFVGGPIGNPETKMSVLGLDEMLDIILRVSVDESVQGAINATQFMTTQRALADALGAALHRPSNMRVPTFAAKMAMGGEQVDELISSNCHAPPAVLNARDHQFRAKSLEELLKRELGAKNDLD